MTDIHLKIISCTCLRDALTDRNKKALQQIINLIATHLHIVEKSSEH